MPMSVPPMSIPASARAQMLSTRTGSSSLLPDLTEFRFYFHGSLLFESDYSTRRISVRI